MPLPILAATVVIGLALILLAVRVFLGGTPARFKTAGDAESAWLREQPSAPVQDIRLSDDGAAALLTLSDGGAGLVWKMGADSAARPVTAQTSVRNTPEGLRISWPGLDTAALRIRLQDRQIRADWADRLSQSSEP